MIRYFKNIAWFSIGSLIILFSLELYLKGTEIKVLYKKFDTEFGSSYKKNTAIHVHKEGLYIGETNSLGFVGDLKKYSEKNYNIAFYGDSFTEAFQLKSEFNFTSLLEKELNKAEKTTILNFGISNVILKDIFIRKVTLGNKFKTNLNVFFVDNFQFINYTEAILNGLDLKTKKKGISIIENKNNSFKTYQKLNYLIENSSCLNMLIDMVLVLKRDQFELFESKPRQKVLKAALRNENVYKNMPEINNKILEELAKENSIFVFRETIEPDIKKLLDHHKIPTYTCKPVLDKLREKNLNPYYWEKTNTIGHFNLKAHTVLANYFIKICQQHKTKKPL